MKIRPILPLLTCCLMAAGLIQKPASAQSVLFIGNSFTFADFGKQARPAGGVPALFKRIAQQDGHAPDVTMIAIPGITLRQHFENAHGEFTAIQSRKWDYVVLQGHSLEATAAERHPGDFLAYGKKFADVIRANDPATKILLYQTWPYPVGHPDYATKFTDQAQMLGQIEAGYMSLAQEIGGATIAPVGDAFAAAQNSPRHFNLYVASDNQHSNDTGYTLSALVFERLIYGKLPDNVTPVLTDISPDDMKSLAAIADSTVGTFRQPGQ